MALLAKASDLGQNASRSSQSFQQNPIAFLVLTKSWFPILFEAWQNIKHFPIVRCQKLQEHVRTVADLYFTRSSQASLSFKAMAGCKICPWTFFRRAKTAVTGPSKMPNDPLEALGRKISMMFFWLTQKSQDQRAELLEMDSLLSSLSACVRSSWTWNCKLVWCKTLFFCILLYRWILGFFGRLK